jgi:hypothetical protein
MRLYLNPPGRQNRLLRVRREAASEQRLPARPAPRQSQHRLDGQALAELIAGYREGAKIKELARWFGIHRNTVTDLLVRHGIELRQVGLSPNQVRDACRLYRDGWSLAKLGDKFGVDDMTVRRYLLLADVAIRSPHERHPWAP